MTIASLTDLDLSYSFTGIKGAKVCLNLKLVTSFDTNVNENICFMKNDTEGDWEDVATSILPTGAPEPDGQRAGRRSDHLLHMSWTKGNTIKDSGFISSCTMRRLLGFHTDFCLCVKWYQQASQTLTYLDLKSNNLTDSGVTSLTNALSSKLTIRKILLGGNRLSLAAVIEARALILKSGAPNIDINFGVSLAEPTPTLCPATAPTNKPSRCTHLSFHCSIQYFSINFLYFLNTDLLQWLVTLLDLCLRFLDR